MLSLTDLAEMKRIVSYLTEFRRRLPRQNLSDREQVESDLRYWKRRIARRGLHPEAVDEVQISPDENQTSLGKPEKGRKS